MRLDVYCQTDGKGNWSSEVRRVRVRNLILEDLQVTGSYSGIYGSLYAVFDTKTWNTDKHGLIYTDKTWLRDFRRALRAKGFSTKGSRDIDFTEQGMQGSDYVSLGFGKYFLLDFLKLSTRRQKRRARR